MSRTTTAHPRPETCRHHWVIETPNGAQSDGFCKHCGSEKLFPNAIDDRVWTGDGFNLSGIPRRAPIA